MVAGEIGYRVVSGIPRIYVCDAYNYISYLELAGYGTIYGTSPTNGEIIITNKLGTLYDYELAVGYNGYWWHDGAAWINESPTGWAVVGEIGMFNHVGTSPAYIIICGGDGNYWHSPSWK